MNAKPHNPCAGRWSRFILVLVALVTSAGLTSTASAFVHPGALHTAADFSRMTTEVNANAHPWIDGWNKLIANSHSSSGYTLQGPVAIVYRGSGYPENYSKLYNDEAAAYQNSLRWRIEGDTACANKAVQIMDAWSGTLTSIQGSADRFLAAGIYGYEFACAAENMRGYSGWSSGNFTRFQNMMKNVFYPMNHDFLVNHNGACITHYWANWDLCNQASMLAIGILCDDTAKFNEAISYYENGGGAGAANQVVVATYSVSGETIGQGQEEGRDQGHSGLDVALLGAFCQMAYNQGSDMFAYSNNRCLEQAEYMADYNLGNSVPYTTYTNCDPTTQTVISSNSRGNIRPCWALIYNHYAVLKGLSAIYSKGYVALVGTEGGGGDYGSSSGGFDQLGFGTLTCTLPTTGGIANGTYRLLNRASGKYLDNLGSTANGAIVAQWSSGSSNNQKWSVSTNGSYRKLMCLTGSKYLDSLGHTADGSTVGQWSSSTSTNQDWMIRDLGTGYYKVVNRSNGKCLDTGGGTTNGSQMQFWGSGSSPNQQWQFVP